MTCIVGVEDTRSNTVYIGGDLLGTNGFTSVSHTQAKVFSRNGVIFGYTTSYRFGQILEHDLKSPFEPPQGEVYPWLVTTLIPSIRKSLSDSGYTDGGSCLIGVHGELWKLQNDYSVLRSVHGFAAVGSGESFAIGAVESDKIRGNGIIQYPEDTIKNAIRITGSHCPSVGVDSTVISTTRS